MPIAVATDADRRIDQCLSAYRPMPIAGSTNAYRRIDR
jgi:hypothetical protein